MIDTHAHINFNEYSNNFDKFINNLKSKNIEKVIIPGVEPSLFSQIINLCDKYDMLYGAIGIHPSEYLTYNSESQEKIYEYTKHKKIVAIGEIGLDYHYGFEYKKEQKIIFEKQLEIASEIQIPVIIHDRDAHEDAFNIIKKYNLKNVVFHCFSGDTDFALKCVENGYYIAIGGVVTFKNAIMLKEAVKNIPIENMLLETDSPYLAPVPFRGKINSPEYLVYIAREIALIKNINSEEVEKQTTINAKRIFDFNGQRKIG